jgi:hypothetical protein
MCADEASPVAPEVRAESQLQAARDLGIEGGRLATVFYADLPCAWWPGAQRDEPPASVPTRAPFPALVLGAALDPATPWSNGERVARSLGRRARAIVTEGGPHVTYGRGETCPDRYVTNLLIRDQLPPSRTTCRGVVTEPYAPLPSATVRGVGSTRDALIAADREIALAPDFLAWSGARPLTIGCPYGGTIRYVPAGAETQLELDRCAWTEGLPLTGEGARTERSGATRLVVDSGDPAAPVTYARSGRGEVSIEGELEALAGGRGR